MTGFRAQTRSRTRRIQIVEQDTGTCVEDDGSLNASPNESSYLAGSEYIVLLSDGGARFGGLGPAEYTFLVSGSIVKTNGFMGSPDSMSLRDFRTLLLKVGQ